MMVRTLAANWAARKDVAKAGRKNQKETVLIFEGKYWEFQMESKLGKVMENSLDTGKELTWERMS